MPEISAFTSHGNQVKAHLNRFPDKCPVCHVAVVCISMGLYAKGVYRGAPCIYAAFRCPRHECGVMYMGEYDQAPDSTFSLRRLIPTVPKDVAFDEGVTKLSPLFAKIYNQAIIAEGEGLDQIAGVGLRKALEFLIKDYCIHKKPDNADTIKTTFLGKCIKDYVEDGHVKICAQRAVWLGNDETHYMREWIGKDIKDLKALIQLTVNWINSELLTEKYLKDMN